MTRQVACFKNTGFISWQANVLCYCATVHVLAGSFVFVCFSCYTIYAGGQQNASTVTIIIVAVVVGGVIIVVTLVVIGVVICHKQRFA